jgi:hypothetical protein
VAAMLGAEHLILVDAAGNAVNVTKNFVPSAFDPAISRRTLCKMTVNLSRSQSALAAETVVLERTQEHLRSIEGHNAALELRVERLSTCIAKLKTQVLGCPRVREALAGLDAALDRADFAEARAQELELQLHTALHDAKKPKPNTTLNARSMYAAFCCLSPPDVQVYMRRIELLVGEVSTECEKRQQLEQELKLERTRRMAAESEVEVPAFLTLPVLADVCHACEPDPRLSQKETYIQIIRHLF